MAERHYIGKFQGKDLENKKIQEVCHKDKKDDF